MNPSSTTYPFGDLTDRVASTLALTRKPDVIFRLNELIQSSVVLQEDWSRLDAKAQAAVSTGETPELMFEALERHGLITPYQLGRLQAGTTFGLILGNYRVLDRLGAGGMGVVFKSEHIVMRRLAAIKVLAVSRDQDQRLLQRFRAEIRAVSSLQHPHVVAALDAGRIAPPEPNLPALHYLAMEFVEGEDLESLVNRVGPLDVQRACEIGYQIASALACGQSAGLVHRDVKPSNVLIASDWQAKLLDFGLAQTSMSGLTEPGSLLGTLEFMAPEQAEDASRVDIRTDLYALGASIYWTLTRKYPNAETSRRLLIRSRRQPGQTPSVRDVRSDVPPELDAVIQKLLAPRPDDRYADPRSLMLALSPFVRHRRVEEAQRTDPGAPVSEAAQPDNSPGRVLIVDDDAKLRQYCRFALSGDEFVCTEAVGGQEGLAAVTTGDFDVVVLDVDMPGFNGHEVLAALRQLPHHTGLRVIMMSGSVAPDDMARLMLGGADDFLTKPFSMPQLRARAQAAVRMKRALERSNRLNYHLRNVSSDLEITIESMDTDIGQLRSALVLCLACVVEHRAPETFGHLVRMQSYCRALAEEAAATPPLTGRIDASFVNDLVCCAPLHDLGIIGLPENVLLKPAKLDPVERAVMESHTILGSDILTKVIQRHGASVGFLRLAVELARSHHERWDGTGYPDRLAGEAIPLSARILAIADMYDALRSKRAYRPALNHNTAMVVVAETTAGQFDPNLLKVFLRCAGRFEQIHQDNPD